MYVSCSANVRLEMEKKSREWLMDLETFPVRVEDCRLNPNSTVMSSTRHVNNIHYY